MLTRTPPGFADLIGQAPALGDGEVAGIGSRAGDHVPGQFGAGLGHADRLQPAVELRQLVGRQVPENQVLAVSDPDGGAHVSLYRGQSPELGRGDVA
jgi:hypothetical protein